MQKYYSKEQIEQLLSLDIRELKTIATKEDLISIVATLAAEINPECMLVCTFADCEAQ